ncbi:MAG: ABC transporter permease [Kofleriaceae bacterium]
MTTARMLRALPTMFRIGVAETLAYRAEFLVWILTTTLPLIMLGLWRTVAAEGPFKQFSSSAFVAYYLATMIVRHVTGSWVAWQISEEIRLGQMSMRLLRPLHPFVVFGASHLAAIPFRVAISVPFAVILLISSGAESLPTDPFQIAMIAPSLALGWLITFSLLFAIGSLAFFITKTMAIFNFYFAMYTMLSGYLLPLELLPRWIRWIAEWTPFPAMLGKPVELISSPMSHHQVIELLAIQGAWAAGCIALALGAWRLGIRRYEAVGG